MIISIDAERSFDTTTSMTLIQLLGKPGTKGNFFKLMKDICGETVANTIFNCERLNAFLLSSGRKQEYLLSPLSFNIVLKAISSVIILYNANKQLQLK